MLIYGVFARGYASVDSPKLLLGAVTVPHEGPVTSFSSLPPLESHHTNIPHHRVNQASFARTDDFRTAVSIRDLIENRLTISMNDDSVSNCIVSLFLNFYGHLSLLYTIRLQQNRFRSFSHGNLFTYRKMELFYYYQYCYFFYNRE